MPADLDQFGSEYSDGAVIGGKGLVKLGHVAADGRRVVNQVNLETRRGKIKRGLNTTDPSTHNHHVSKITPFETLANTVCEAFTDLVFNLCEFCFHFSLSLSSEESSSHPCLFAGRKVINNFWTYQKSLISLPGESP